MSLTVKEVIKKSPAKKAGLKKGDIVHQFDNIKMHDFIDDTYVNTLVNPNIVFERKGKIINKKLDKGQFDTIGIEYEEDLYPQESICHNNCMFCFVAQLPKGMRETLYVKDDDWRYSVLYGNYITMTNMDRQDFERIATRKVSPLYISVHATDAIVRSKMMRNKNATKILEQLSYLYDNHITFHCQIVLCPGINDGDVLEKSLRELVQFYPYCKTVSIVPVGLTKYRDGLSDLTPVSRDYANKLINKIDKFREKYKRELGNPFVFLADEFYSKAQIEFPRYELGEINEQKANGVGLFSDFLGEFEFAIDELKGIEIDKRKVIIVTGVSAYNKIKSMCDELMVIVENLEIEVIKVINNYFGKSITVAGLLTGNDIINAIGNKKADAVFIPYSSLKNDEDIFLDNMTLKNLEKEIDSCVIISPNDGYDFAINVCGRT
jgi:putative radical SAM enzyme (TIGR03279 family)